MKTLVTITLISILGILFTRCTIEKRLYNNGFHVEWKKNFHSNRKEKIAEKKIPGKTTYTLQEYSTTDSAIQISSCQVASKHVITPKIIRQNVEEHLTGMNNSLVKTKNTNLEKKQGKNLSFHSSGQDNEREKPVNKRALTSAIVFGAIAITFLVIASSFSPLGMGIMAILAAVMSIVLFIKAFSKKEQTKSQKPKAENLTSNEKKNLTALGIIVLITIPLAIASFLLGILAVDVLLSVILVIGGIVLGAFSLISLCILLAMSDSFKRSPNPENEGIPETVSEPENPEPKIETEADKSAKRKKSWFVIGILAVVASIFIIDANRK